ncbi:MAG: hypothetical protein HOH58_09775 [Opitutaceae bacterium]|mgnify:CR=1 FL=1|jgi:hypothetical protein|nr:hypothetical protein [Opitutaceae bacterium]
MKPLLITVLLMTAALSTAETDRPHYYEIPDAPEGFSGPHVAARMVDGLGFRYFWATEGLRAEDLNWSPDGGEQEGKVRRTSADTIDHIYNLALIVANATRGEPTKFPVEIEGLTFAEKRAATLGFIKQASDQLRAASEADMERFDMVFVSESGTQEHPFWNAINGPIGDALWHTGQIVSFRRSSGNPFPSNVSLLSGKVRE